MANLLLSSSSYDYNTRNILSKRITRSTTECAIKGNNRKPKMMRVRKEKRRHVKYLHTCAHKTFE
jgi:hypothetical protein